MKTLKKSLCLILALVFVLGLCTVGAGAAFTDAADIKYADAVGIMADLGILSGMGDGTFAPTASVTRAQAAKMIAYMILGKDNAEKMPATGSFDDVNAGDWYAKYVGYCAKQGIINGMGDGTFRPDAPVTGTQLAKMILCAVGFGKGNEYVGDGWDFNAVADALTYGIYNGSEAADFAAEATREECALYVYNALIGVKQQSYKDGAYADGAQTYGEKVWKLQNKTGIVMANKAAGDTATKIKLDGAADTTAFAADTGLDLIGHEVRVLYKDVKNDKGVYTSVYAVTDISEVIPAFTTVGKLEKAATVNSIANYVVTPNDAYVAPKADSMIFNDLILFNGKIIGEVATESFSIAQVKSIDAKTGAYTLDDGTVTDKTWTLCDAAKGDYIEVVKVGVNTITRATSKFENIKVTQITNAKFPFAASYNNGQFVQSAATNVADYLEEAKSNLTLGNSYTFYKDSKGSFFRAEIYSAPAAKTSAVFFVKSFTIKGSDTYDEWGQTVGAKDAYYAQCVTATGESVNYITKEAYTGTRGPVSLSFDDKGNAVFGTASDVKKITGADWSKAAITKLPANPWYLTSDCTIIVLSGKLDIFGKEQAAELGTLKVETLSALKGNFAGIDMYVAIPDTTATAKDIQTIWIDGAAAATTEPEKPVADSYIYVTDATQVGQKLLADGKTTVGTYNVYIDGVKTEVAMKAAPSLGFFAYTVKDDVYTLSTDSAVTKKEIALNGTVTLYKGVFSSSDEFDGKSIAGMTVVDLRAIDPAKAVTDVAGLEKLTDAVTLTVLMTSKGAFVGVIYVS